MIRKLTLICMCGLTMGAQADSGHELQLSLCTQTDLLTPVQPSYLKHVTAASGWAANWFMDVTGGATAFVGTPLGCEDLFGRITPSLSVSLGKWFTPAVGAKVSFQGFRYKDCMLATRDYRHLHADLLWNVTGSHYHARDRPWAIVPYAGLGIIRNEDSGNSPFALSYGLMVRYRLAERLHLTMELGGTTTSDDFDSYSHSDSREFGDNLFSVKAGLSITLGKVGWKRVIDARPYMTRNEQLVDYLSCLQAENAKLAAQNSHAAQLMAEMKKIMEIEGLLVRYRHLLDTLEKESVADKGGYPKNDYSGLNSLRARMMNSTGTLAGDSIAVRAVDSDTVFQSSRYMSHGSDSLLAAAYLSSVTNDSCIGSPVYLFFTMGTATLTDSSQLIHLDDIARIVKQYGLAVRVVGAADSATGNPVINDRLSNDRADYILTQLLQRSVDIKCIEKIAEGGINRYTPAAANRHTRIELCLR